jgi:hypothetical protein
VLRRIVALLPVTMVLAGVAFWGSAATAAETQAAAFVRKANAERTSRGLPAYTVASDLATVARRHSERMAAKHTLYHNPNLGSEVSGWQVVGENVGMGGDVDSIHQAFMDSPEHRANILARDYTQIGIGTVVDADGVLWVTQVFRLPMKATVTVAAPAKPRVVIASRSRTTAPRRPAAAPVRAAAPAPVSARAAAPAPVAVDAADVLGALADATAVDAFGQALAYADAMAAF